MSQRVIGCDPSFRALAISDGSTTVKYGTDPVIGVTDEESHLIRVHKTCAFIDAWLKPYDGEEITLWVEAPLLNAKSKNVQAGTHLFQAGFLYHGMLLLAQQRTFDGKPTTIKLIARGTYLKQLLGKGRIAETELAKSAYKRYGIDFTADAGLDKLEAWLIWRYGCGVRDGEWRYTAPQRDKRIKESVRAATPGIG